MKSVGEIMAIGRRFEEAVQKGIRMLETGFDGLVLNRRLDLGDLRRSSSSHGYAVAGHSRGHQGRHVDRRDQQTDAHRQVVPVQDRHIVEMEAKLKDVGEQRCPAT